MTNTKWKTVVFFENDHLHPQLKFGLVKPTSGDNSSTEPLPVMSHKDGNILFFDMHTLIQASLCLSRCLSLYNSDHMFSIEFKSRDWDCHCSTDICTNLLNQPGFGLVVSRIHDDINGSTSIFYSGLSGAFLCMQSPFGIKYPCVNGQKVCFWSHLLATHNASSTVGLIISEVQELHFVRWSQEGLLFVFMISKQCVVLKLDFTVDLTSTRIK